MKNLIVLIILLSVSYSQEFEKKNNVFFQFLGNGGLYSMNYERILFSNVSVRTGFSYLGSRENGKAFTIPVLINLSTKSNLEFGIGITYYKSPGNKSGFFDKDLEGVWGNGNFSYRYEYESGVNFKLSFTPVFNSTGILPLVGFSVGKRF